MAFVQRRHGLIVGVFTAAQPGYAEEQLADDHPDVVKFMDKAKAFMIPDNKVKSKSEKLADMLSENGLTLADLKAELGIK